MKPLPRPRFQALILASALVFPAVFPAACSAQQPAQRWLFDTPRAPVGAWRVVATTDTTDVCVAEIDNAQVTLRVLFNQTLDAWYLANPYYEDDHPTAQFGIGQKGAMGETIQMRSDVVEAWAMYQLPQGPDALSGFVEGQYVNIKLDRGAQTWPVSHGAQLVDALKACTRTVARPVTPAPDVPTPVVPAPAPAVPPRLTVTEDNMPCPEPGSVTSPGSSNQVLVTFKDPSHKDLAKTVYWLGFKGELVEMGPIFDGVSQFLSYEGHKFLVKDHQGRCHGGIHTVGPDATMFTLK